MSDEMNMAAPDGVVGIAEKKPGFLSTPTGKIVAIVVGVAALGIVLGLIFVIVMFAFGDQSTEVVQQESPAASGSATTTATVEVKSPAAEIANAELFTFRNIFDPLIKPVATSADSTDSSSTTSSSTTDTLTPTSAGTLYLDGVVTEDGVLKAQLRYNGTSYTLGAGGVIPNSPWQVLRVSSSAVTMLYGDVQVTLAVGQGITK